jgi:F420-dependent oxidoreductase-like protein
MMRLGLWFSNYRWQGDQVSLGDTFATIAQRAERAGLSSLWVPDHFLMPTRFGDPDENMLDSWTALAFLAGRTNQVKLGTMVTGVTYRHPGLLLKIATTLDVLSHGRAYLGLGAGWYKEEHEAYGVPFPSTSERFERLEETLQIAHQMWSPDAVEPYIGKHYQLAHPNNAPQTIQKPHPPLLVAGGGERKTLRLVAQYADAYNLAVPATAEQSVLRQKLDVLREHCQALGRPYEQIEKTTLSTLHLTRDGRNQTMTPQAAIEYFALLASQGVDHAIFSLANVSDLEPFELLTTVIVPEVSGFSVAGRLGEGEGKQS